MRKTILLGLIVGALPFVVAAVAQAKPSRTTGACCFWPSGNCIDLTEADCIAQGGTYIGGTTCVSYVCPHGEPSCANLPTVTMPAQSPYSDPHQHTCGRVNDFDSTCLGDYDGGEDIVYKLIVTEDTCVDITVTGNTPTNNWFGVGVDVACPLGTTCMAVANSGSGTVAMISGLILQSGTYYVMVDTWPAPSCLTDFTLNIATGAACSPAACCLPSGCVVMNQSTCTAVGGVHGIPGSACSGLDCNGNGQDDSCDIGSGTSQDCNGNGVPDECDLASGASGDCSRNGVPDECEAPLPIANFVAVLVGTDNDELRQCMADVNRDGAADGEDIPFYVGRVLGS